MPQLVSFFHAYGVSCRARAEEAGPTTTVVDSPQNRFPRCYCIRRSGMRFFHDPIAPIVPHSASLVNNGLASPISPVVLVRI
jgi:hypothetical protein